MIDFHSHIIPRIDDGSSSVDETVEMLSLSKCQGINYMVATPHFYASEESPSDFLHRRSHYLRKTLAATETLSLPKIISGAEVGYFEGMSDCDDLKNLTILGTPLLMVEMPVCRWSDRMLYELNDIYEKQDIIPLIAHIDRYIKLLHNKKITDKLKGLPVLIQANASFFVDKKTARLALSLLSKEKIHLLGSDCHNMTSRRPNLGDAFDVINEKLGKDALQRIQANGRLVFSQKKSLLEELFI